MPQHKSLAMIPCSKDVRNDETTDDLLRGRLKILQKKQGYRFSLDAVLLAHFAVIESGGTVFDLGTGSGVIPLILSGIANSGKIVGLEIQNDMADMAGRSILLNDLQDLIQIVPCDLRQIHKIYEGGVCDVAIFNPPYRKLHSGRINPESQKAIARHELQGGLEDFVSAAAYLLRPYGRCYLIYKARRLAHVFSTLKANKIEPKRIRMVHSRFGSEGEFVLLEGYKNGGEELSVMPPLVIYENDGSYTAEAAEMLKSG